MKNSILIFLVFQISLTSCNQIKLEEIEGRWSYLPGNSKAPQFTEFIINNGTIELIADDLFKELGTVEIKGDKLSFNLLRDELNISYIIDNLEVDTMKLNDSLTFLRNSYLGNGNFEDYELIDISTDKLLSAITNYYKTIHFYKSVHDELRIRCGDSMTELKDVSLFLSGHHDSPHETMILIGQGIELIDLKQLYIVLRLSGQLKISLGTKRNGLADTEVFRDYVEIWWDDAEEFRKSQQPMPPPSPPQPFKSKRTFLGSDGKEIHVKSNRDIELLNSLNGSGKYVIEIDKNLSIEQYIKVKQTLKEIKKTNKEIRTSIE